MATDKEINERAVRMKDYERKVSYLLWQSSKAACPIFTARSERFTAYHVGRSASAAEVKGHVLREGETIAIDPCQNSLRPCSPGSK